MTAFKHVIVVGAGTMGHGIAQVCAMHGFRTTLLDQNPAALDFALGRITANLDLGIQKGKISAEIRHNALSSLRRSTDSNVFAEGDLLIEAVPENMALKQAIFREADQKMPVHALLATNTSSLSLTQIGSVTNRPDLVVGLHFFNPAHLMKLLEIVKSNSTSQETLKRVQDFGQQIGKTSIVVNDSPGFATSRLGIAFALEAMRMFEQGVASVQDIDQAMTLGYGHPMGPLKLSDLVGLDVRLAIAKHLHGELKSEAFVVPKILEQLVASGNLGQKTGCGFYQWDQSTCLQARTRDQLMLSH